MDFMMHLPVVLKVLGSLTVILILTGTGRRLSLSLVCGTAVLAFWCGHSPAGAAQIAWDRICSRSNLLLMLIIFEVIWLSSQMAACDVMKELVGVVRAGLSRRLSMAVLPALIGSLPMPGGALFSAPLVDSCDDGQDVPPLTKTRINYWFRHVWEYWWPLYPGVLLTIDIWKIDIWQFMLLQFPMSLAAISAGYFFLLRPITEADESGTKLAAIPFGKLLRLAAPILTVIAVYALARAAFPRLIKISRYLPMAAGLASAMILLQIQKPLPLEKIKEIAIRKRTLKLAVIVCLVRIYGAFIEAELPSGDLLVDQMRLELADLGIPMFAIIIILPLISGLSTGLAVGFVGASMPIIASLVGQTPEAGILPATVLMAYAAGYAGMILSPIHVCLVVTNEHFGTRLARSLRGLIPPATAVLAFAALMHVIIRVFA